MKRTPFLFAILTAFVWSLGPSHALFAQQPNHPMEEEANASMMGHDMMQGSMMEMMQGSMMEMHQNMMTTMMADPVQRSMLLTYALPSLQTPLDLGDTQVASLEQLKQRFIDQRMMLAETSQRHVTSAQETLTPAPPDLIDLRKHLRAAYEAQADIQTAAVETALQMYEVLTPEQQAQLDQVAPMELHKAMMQALPMMEMMQAMHDGMGCAGMMGEMMQGEMMGSMPSNDASGHEQKPSTDHEQHHR